MRNPRVTFAIILGVIGILALAAGVVYLAIPAHSLPSWIPGHISGKHGRKAHSTRGVAGVGLGVVLLVISIGIYISTRRSRARW